MNNESLDNKIFEMMDLIWSLNSKARRLRDLGDFIAVDKINLRLEDEYRFMQELINENKEA